MDFTKLDDTEFPNIETVDVYAFKNDFDFKRFDNAQMTIHVLNVPWDMGEAHVGQRTITGIGNVVKFDSDDERDKWFQSKRYATTPEQWASGGFDGFKWTTKYRHFHNGDDLKIPLPFDIVSRFNYAFITYEPAPDASNPVDYEQHGLLKWFLFIRNFQMLSVNTTACTVKRDTWQTYINHIKFKGMMLEQGHYPFTLTTVDDYLTNPIDNTSGLLDEDVQFGELSRVTHSDEIILNDSDMQAVIVTSGSPTANWGNKSDDTWKVPNGNAVKDGQPSFRAFAMPAGEFNTFISNVNTQHPQFIQTVKAVFFAASKLVTLGDSFTFADVSCRWLSQRNNVEHDLLDLTKSQFGYGARYRELVKLYTYPYAAIEITDENGNSNLVRVEDTSGELSLITSISTAFPWIKINGRLSGIGGTNSKTVTFRNITARSFTFGGRWYDYLMDWSIPTFAVTQTASTWNDYATHFDREQQLYAARQTNANALDTNETANTNALASNATNNANALASNATEKANADASADVSVTNQGVQNAANSAVNSQTATNINLNVAQDNSTNTIQKNISNDVTSQTTNNQVDAAYAGAAISALGSVGSGAASGAAAGMAMGPPGMAVGAAVGAIGGAVGSITGLAQTAVSNNLLESQAGVQIAANNAQVSNVNIANLLKSSYQVGLNAQTIDINNDSAMTQTVNNAGVIKANASRTKSTGDANANRTKATGDANANREKAMADTVAARNLAIENSAVDNSIKQAALRAPMEFGDFANGETAATKPIAVFANIVTQSKDAIEKTGDHFLRYGYRYAKYIDFKGFNLMPKFTYWKCSDVWVYGLDMADEHMDEIRFFLMGGVTVWRKPEYIGTTSIYDNV